MIRCFFVIFFLFSNNVIVASTTYKNPMTDAESLEFFSYKPGDIFVGDPKNAKVVVTGYTSYSCPHCSHFVGDIMPKLKKEFFENKDKKVVYIYRAFAMSIADVRAKQIMLCKKLPNKDMVKLTEMFYATSSTWSHDAKFEQKLTEIARLFGFSDQEVAKCMASKDLEKKIVDERSYVLAKTKLMGIPLIAVNGKVVDGYSYKSIVDEIKKAL